MAHNRSALNADKEMRRLFGGNAAAAGGRGARAQRRGGRGGGGSMGHKLPGKKSSIVTPQDHWPSVLHCGVGMVASSAADGRRGVYYELRYTDEYRQGQQLFAAMAATHDPQNLVDVLHQHPYQLDTLLQMSQIYAQMGEQQQAADLLERAVYCLEQASHPAFIAGLGGAAEGGGVDRGSIMLWWEIRCTSTQCSVKCKRPGGAAATALPLSWRKCCSHWTSARTLSASSCALTTTPSVAECLLSSRTCTHTMTTHLQAIRTTT